MSNKEVIDELQQVKKERKDSKVDPRVRASRVVKRAFDEKSSDNLT